jgi:hypothetical protein
MINHVSKIVSSCLVVLIFALGLLTGRGQTAPFNTGDTGTLAPTGTTTCSSGTVTITGEGTALGTTGSDSCQFGYQTLLGDGAVVAQVQTLGSGAWTGVMIRQNMTAGSPEIQVVTDGSAVSCMARTTAGSAGTTVGTGTSTTVPAVWVKIVRSGTTFTAYCSANTTYHYSQAIGSTDASWTLIGSVTISAMSGPTQAGVVQCARGSTAVTSTCGCVVVTPGIPWGWQDVGAVGVTGSLTYSTSTLSVTAGGSSIGGTGTADSFGYAYQTLTGNGTIITRVPSQTGVDAAGVVIRQDATAGSPMVALTRGNGTYVVLDARLTANAAAVVENTGTTSSPGVYLMMERAGNTISAYRSNTGTAGPWSEVGSPVTVSMGTGPVKIGVEECSQVNTLLKTGNFDHLSVVPFAGQDIGTVGVAGLTTYGLGTCTVVGAGAHLGSKSTADAFQFDYQNLTGTGTFTACLTSQDSTDKSGIVMREDTTAGSPMVSLAVTGTTVMLEDRISENAAATSLAIGPVSDAPVYLQLARSGNNYTAYTSTLSPSGPWTQLGSTVSVYLGAGAVLTGLAECSQTTSATATATFSGATLVQKPSAFSAYIYMANTTGLTIPPTFMGLSHEWSSNYGAQYLMGAATTSGTTTTITDTNIAYRNLLKNLTNFGSGPLNIRVGGDSTDNSSTYTPSDFAPIPDLAKNANVQFELGVNLATGTTTVSGTVTLAENQASNFVSAMASAPSTALAALEIGNEPDEYTTGMHPHRTSGYKIQPNYISDFGAVASEIFPDLPAGGYTKLMGPAFASTDTLSATGSTGTTNLVAFLTAYSGSLSLFSQHYYTESPSSGTKTLPVDCMLDPQTASNGPNAVLSAIATTASYSTGTYSTGTTTLPFRMDEFGALSGLGNAGASNTFASSLWAINTMFQFAREGLAGVNFETSDNCTEAFWFNRTGSTGSYTYALASSSGTSTLTTATGTITVVSTSTTTVDPLYYGMLFFQQATGHGSKLSTNATCSYSTSNLVAYETITSTGTVQLTIDNEDETVGGTVSVTMPGYAYASVYRLAAPTFQSTFGVTYAGQTFDNSPDGTIQPPSSQVIESVAGNNGQFQIPVPITSAVLVIFGN